MMGKFPNVLNFNRLFLKLNRFICNLPPVLPEHGEQWCKVRGYSVNYLGLVLLQAYESWVIDDLRPSEISRRHCLPFFSSSFGFKSIIVVDLRFSVTVS